MGEAERTSQHRCTGGSFRRTGGTNQGVSARASSKRSDPTAPRPSAPVPTPRRGAPDALGLGLAILGLAVGVGCGASAGSPAAPDAIADSGTAAPIDGGRGATTSDATPSSGPTVDGGPDAEDAGGPDGAVDGRVGDDAWSPSLVALAHACVDAVDDVYVTPTGLPALTPATRGTIVRCAVDSVSDASTVASAMAGKGVAFSGAPSAVHVYRVAFRTFRSNGSAAISSAKVWLPDAPLPGPLPVVTVAHPSEGMADSCATSRSADKDLDLALPLAAHGWAVIAADYAGLGTDGVQGYLDQRDTAQSVLDAARALRNLLSPGAFSDRVVAVGYSQGGGAVLAAQGLHATYGSGGTLAAVVAYAPEWQGRLDSFRFVDLLRDPTALTISYGVTYPVVATMRAYGHQANDPATTDGSILASGASAQLIASMNSLCLTEYGAAIHAIGPHIGDLFDDAARTALLACVDGTSGCNGPGKSFFDWLESNDVPTDPRGAPILYVQGLADTIMEPAREAACNVTRLAATGTDYKLCTDDAATHTNVAPRNAAMAIGWIDAMLAGREPPSCGSSPLPACTP
jgi:hypothetical protein